CDNPYPYIVGSLTEGMLNKLANHYLEQLAKLTESKPCIITDKMPENFLHLGIIQLLFPDARIVHCTRNPIDTCISCYFQEFSGTHSYAYNMSDLGTYYALYQKLMAHWNDALSLPIITVNYEAMIQETAQTCHQLFDFLGLKWEEECLSFHKLDRPVATASSMQVKQPIYSHSINRRDNYRAHLQPLIETLGEI
ncbi:MAG: sulfotransferase, partial [Gammaproteobacteria bacterium]